MYFFQKILCIFLLALVVPSKASYSEEKLFISIFFLGSGSSESRWTDLVSQGIRTSLEQSSQPYVYYTDHLDAGRFDEVEQHNVVFHYLKDKFKKNSPDIFITAGPAASHFSVEHPDLFPLSKRILIKPKQGDIVKADGAIVIETDIDYSLIVKEALRLSSPESFYIIGDTKKPSDVHRLQSLTLELEKEGVFYKRIENKSLDLLIQEVSKISKKSAIFFTPIYRKHGGKGLPPVLVLKKLHEVSHAPIFATSVAELGFGSVGGYLHSPKELGLMAGEAVLDSINRNPINFSNDGFELAYDWNEVNRWGYQSKISDKAEVRFKPHSLWDEHTIEVFVTTSFLAILIVLSTLLSIYNGKLKKARSALTNERRLLEQKVAERTQELSILHKEAERMARIDELTGINNRRAFFENGEFLHNQTQRTGNVYAVLMIDIDDFKTINDTYGHSAGDSVIINVANVLSSASRKSDIVARIGGEEFALILTNATLQQANEMAERLRIEVEALRVQFEQCVIKTTISVGCTMYKLEDTGVGSVLARADNALYLAKGSGKNKIMSVS